MRRPRQENLEADRIVANREKAPHSVQLARALYVLAGLAETLAAAEAVEAIGWSADDLANRGEDVDRRQVAHAFAQAEGAMA